METRLVEGSQSKVDDSRAGQGRSGYLGQNIQGTIGKCLLQDATAGWKHVGHSDSGKVGQGRAGSI